MKAAAFLAALALVAITPSAHAAGRCSKPRARTLLENPEARLFSVKGKGEVKRRVYGCVRGHRPILLTTDDIPRDLQNGTAHENKEFRLAGRFVAWIRVSYSDFGAGEFGRRLEERALEPGHRSVTLEATYYESVSFEVRDDGAVAWLLTGTGVTSTPGYREVGAVEAEATEPIGVAYASGINPFSLRLDAAGVHWSQDGAEHTFPLEPGRLGGRLA